MNEYFISQCRTSKSRIRYEYRNCRQATRAEKPAATFSVLGLSHVMRYISVRYLLTYLLTYWNCCYNRDATEVWRPRHFQASNASGMEVARWSQDSCIAVVTAALETIQHWAFAIYTRSGCPLAKCDSQSINQSINQYSYSSGMTKRRSTGYNNITNYTKH